MQGTSQHQVKGLGILRFSQKNVKIDKFVAVCRHCKCDLKYFGNATNLSNHLHIRHAINADISAAASTAGADLRSLSQSITRFICKDMHPYCVVENTGFREIINTLEPRYKIPSRQFFSEKFIPELYRSTKEDLQLELSQSAHVTLTTDSWRSCSTVSYVKITAHLISMNWQNAELRSSNKDSK